MAALQFTPVSILWMLFVVAALGLAFVIGRARPVTPGNVALLALMVQQACSVGGSIFFFATTDVAVGTLVSAFEYWALVLLLWAPIAFLAGPLLLGSSREGRFAQILGVAGSLPSALLVGAWFVRRELVVDGPGSLSESASLAVVLAFVGYAFTVAVLAREALATPFAVRRGQFALLAAAFSVEGAYHAAQDATRLVRRLDLHGVHDPGSLFVVVGLVPIAIYVGLTCVAAFVASSSADASRRRWARLMVVAIVAAAASGAATSSLGLGEGVLSGAGAFHVLWDLAALALVFYAGMRFQLFSLERHAKRSVAVTTMIVLGFVTFNVIQEFAEGVLAGTRVLAGLPAAGVIAALAVAAASIPIGRVGFKVGARLFPHVVATPDYESDRKFQIYLAALEGAFSDGVATPREASSLKRLRAELGVTESDHDALELRVRGRLAAETAGTAPA